MTGVAVWNVFTLAGKSARGLQKRGNLMRVDDRTSTAEKSQRLFQLRGNRPESFRWLASGAEEVE